MPTGRRNRQIGTKKARMGKKGTSSTTSLQYSPVEYMNEVSPFSTLIVNYLPTFWWPIFWYCFFVAIVKIEKMDSADHSGGDAPLAMSDMCLFLMEMQKGN